MMRQYYEIKSGCEDAILFFRLGDFYEMFYDDAYKASRILGLTLTSRGKDENGEKIPMCGIPYHAANNYIPKLLAQNIKIAICEQTEDPSQAKGLTRREVVKILTPGTVLEDNLLQSQENNYLMAISNDTLKNNFGLAYCDISTGEFFVTEINDPAKLVDEIEKINPKEILTATNLDIRLVQGFFTTVYNPLPYKEARDRFLKFYNIHSAEAVGLEDFHISFSALAAILNYLEKTKKITGFLNKPKRIDNQDYLYMNAVTLKNLEVLSALNPQNKSGSLIWVLDMTRTSMGARLLRKWCAKPLYNRELIQQRLDAVDFFHTNFGVLAELDSLLGEIYDLERLNVKIANQIANPRDLISIKNSLNKLPALYQILKEIPSNLKNLLLFPEEWLKATHDMSVEIEKIILDEPPVLLNNGGIVKSSYSEELDKLREDVKNSKQWFIDLEIRLKKETNIKSLKVNYNKVFGYYIEVTTTNLPQVPDYFIRKQTISTGERFYTQELKEKENFILHADEIIIKKEIEIFTALLADLKKYTDALQIIADKISVLDCLTSLAKVARANNYKKPVLNDNGLFKLQNSRHPVLEKKPDSYQFVANDAFFDTQTSNFVILTGPNMAGKSTYMRQIALIIIMAQIGSFVPAQEANISLTDKLFARIGASDNLFEGKSTFMMEMLESSGILHNATKDSFIILDEIGRGTSTFDGLSIAASIAKYIYKQIQAKTMFATHYHEITSLTEQYPLMKNMNIAVVEEQNKIRFTYKVIPGKAEKSYGIHVADLAGLPKEIIRDATKILEELEKEEISLHKNKTGKIKQLSLF
ncbi:MAG: DNA mismatch repair protein MutS [Candidatus Margulisbacteria bacterium]|nr:DNA mismatch repair protein MutS [Candidatus Margulisiibacteriota bacterium]